MGKDMVNITSFQHTSLHVLSKFALPRERDLVLMEIFQSLDLSREMVLSLNRCSVSLESIFLSDIPTTDGQYLEDAVFNPDRRGRSSASN